MVGCPIVPEFVLYGLLIWLFYVNPTAFSGDHFFAGEVLKCLREMAFGNVEVVEFGDEVPLSVCKIIHDDLLATFVVEFFRRVVAMLVADVAYSTIVCAFFAEIEQQLA